METTQYEIEKLGLNVLQTRYEDFVKDPKVFIQNVMDFMQLPPSKNVDNYMNEMVVSNRNARASKKTTFSDETKQRIMEIVGEYA
jgi:hypothetical protein